ncbi:MAG TPA: class I SAM-dependent methyltransferase, partial [Verrucomicrobiae bacterium]|nr:class I SAM-dependent methyltransferase [Verrucomicrobiae bacterium]
MNDEPTAGAVDPCAFWDGLAYHHAEIEDNFLNRQSIRRMLNELRGPVLIVGAGQGLLMEEVRSGGLACDGLDWSREMIRQAKSRRGLEILHGDAQAMPIPDRKYGTVLYATGVIDFSGDDIKIKAMLQEGRRVTTEPRKLFVAFYRGSLAQQEFLLRVGLVRNGSLDFRESLKLYFLGPGQTISWTAKRANISPLRALMLVLRMAAFTTIQEKRTTFLMQKIIRGMDDPESFIRTAPETL